MIKTNITDNGIQNFEKKAGKCLFLLHFQSKSLKFIIKKMKNEV